MQLYLQFGHGMRGLTTELLQLWGTGSVILSPRDLTEDQLNRAAAAVRSAGGEPLLDPQCYVHDADHPGLTRHSYWREFQRQSTANLLTPGGTTRLLQELRSVNVSLGLQRHILPGLMAGQIDDDWFQLHDQIIDSAQNLYSGIPLLATVALSERVMRDEVQIEAVVDHVSSWPVDGFYVIAETPSSYLVDDPIWLANLLILASGLKLLDRFVLVGYCNHQMLSLAATNIDAIASGTWMNVRAFSTGKFYVSDTEQRKATWYYCPQALSEYTVPFLDIAMRNGVLDHMRPDTALSCPFAGPLFQGARPSATNWREPDAFRHYLSCLKSQCTNASAASFDAAMSSQTALLDRAETVLSMLRASGVFGQVRDFSNLVDVNRGALVTLSNARGASLRRHW